jgi:hypothetical protein
MPKNAVSDPITDQEMAFALLVLSGTMNDRAAAEAVGLNPDSAAYTKSRPRVRDYMIEHRNAVREKLVKQEAEGLRKLNLGRDQVLTRLWELANLSHELTRGIIAGQIKALSMIVAIEGFIPGRGPSASETQSTAPPVKAQNSDWRPQQQHQPVGEGPRHTVAETKTPPMTPQATKPEPTPEPTRERANGMASPNLNRPQVSVANPFIHPERQNWVPDAASLVFDAVLDSPSFLRLSFPSEKGLSGRCR